MKVDKSKGSYFDGQRFHNQEPSGRSFKTFLKWQLTRKPAVWPAWVDIQPNIKPATRVMETDRFLVTYINHATVLIQIAGLNILTDPLWSLRCSPFQWLGPKRVYAPGIPFEHLPPIDVVLISHNHYDHLDLPTIARLQKQFKPRFYTGLGNKRIIQKRAAPENIIELDWWQSITLSEQVQLTYVPAHHWSARGLFDSNKALWGGFVVQTPEHNIYFAGDTAYGKHFRQIQQRFGAISLAMLPIGAYEARWFMKGAHINPEEAVIAHQELHARYSLGIHFDTFAKLTDEAYGQASIDLTAAREKYRINDTAFRTLKPGEVWEITQ